MVVHLVVRLVMTHRAQMAQVRVRPLKNQDTSRATAMVVVEEAEVMIPTVRSMVALSPSRIRNPKLQAGEDTGNKSVPKRRKLNDLRCQTHCATERG